MAAKINAGDYTRGELFYIPPNEIIIEDKLNGRWEPHNEAAIDKMVKSFEEQGQLQPVQVRKLKSADNRVQLVLGYRRTYAAIRYNELHPEKPIKLKCVLVDINDDEAFQRNIIENKERSDPSPVDDAFNQRRLRENLGWTEAQIAKFYDVTSGYISQLKVLTGLPSKILKLVHAKQISVTSGISLADLSGDEQEAALTELAAGGQITTATVRKTVRKKKQAKGGKQARTLAEVREFFESMTGPAETDGVRAMAGVMLRFIAGKTSDEEMAASINELLTFDIPEDEPASHPDGEPAIF